MTLVYHANRAYLYCDPAEDLMPLVDKSDYDDLAAELAEYKSATNFGAVIQARIRALEQDVTDVAKINVDLMKRNRALEAQMRGQTFQTPDEKDARIGKLEAELGQWRQRGSIVGVIIRDEEGKDWKWDGSQWCAFGSTVEAKAFVIHSDSCPVRRPDFVPIEGVTQCNCDFGKRLAAAMGVPITAETKAELAAGCHRSHPHEDMDAGCQRLTEIARTNNALARETNAEPAKLMPCWCPYCGEPHSPAVRETKGEQG